MATKTISITEEAYERLKALKKENESFSIVINRVVGKKKHKLRDLHGILAGRRGEALEKSIAEGRKLHREMHKKRTDKLLKELS
jgi:predicted CopG family antitoxin